MTDSALVGAAAGSFGLLCAVLGWLGQRMVVKLDEIAASLAAMDRRVTVVETMQAQGAK